MDFGLTIRKLRREKKLTQEALGAQLGVKKQMISNYESGLHPFPEEKIRTLSSVLGVEILAMQELYAESKGSTKPASDEWAHKTVEALQDRINALERDKVFLQQMLEKAISSKGNFNLGNASLLFPFYQKSGSVAPRVAA